MVTSKRNSNQAAATDADQAFERWVARQLHKIYDEVLAEEVPADLLRVVERFDDAAGSAPKVQNSSREDKPETNGNASPEGRRRRR
jgi:hypothetical protein